MKILADRAPSPTNWKSKHNICICVMYVSIYIYPYIFIHIYGNIVEYFGVMRDSFDRFYAPGHSSRCWHPLCIVVDRSGAKSHRSK